MAELHDLTALEQGAALRRGEVSAAELVEHYRGRADRLDREVGAYISRTDAVAERQARAVADRLAAADPAESLGPLFGTVVPVKDLNAFAGVRMTLGSAAVELVPTADDDVVARMRAGGLVMPGKTNTPEFGLPCYTENAVAPPARTPWDPTRSAGGSSGGAAAAVAAGMVSAAQGSDGGGSIRIPASVTGLVGVKPSRGRVGNGPLPEAVGELAVQGVLARTVRDAAALLDVLIGDASRGELLTAAGRDPGRLRIGRYAVPVIADAVVDPAVLAGYERTAMVLGSLGHEVLDVPPPFEPAQVAAFEAVWSVLAAMVPVPAEREPLLLPLTRWLRGRGEAVGGVELARAVAAMRVLGRDTVASTEHLDVVLTPTLAALPAAVGGIRDDDDPASDFAAQKRFTPFTSPYNISGQPAMSLPLHEAEVGGAVLPVGMQLVGRPGGEATLFSLAAQLETAMPWRDRRPPSW